MDNDKKILENMKEMGKWIAYYIDFVEKANTCAHTDRIVERVTEIADEVKKLHEAMFQEPAAAKNPNYYAVTGFNTKQVWVYSDKDDAYIDPPKDVLDYIDSQTKSRDWDAKEALLDKILETNPDWLNDRDYIYNADDIEI